MDINNEFMCAHPFAYSKLVEDLKRAGLRPTRQRVILAKILFEQGNRHITAEQLHREVRESSLRISLATVYNTLNQFVGAGLLREIQGHSAQTYFDTRVEDHHHFILPSGHGLMDIPVKDVEFGKLPPLPEGMEIDKVQVTIRLKKKSA